MVKRAFRSFGRNYELSGEEKFYFFTSRTRKYPNGSRPACTAGGGYWKAKGSEKKIYNDDELVGVKKTLVYYRGKAKKNGVKTDWTMQEYISEITTCKSGDSMKLDDWVLCCIHKKRGAVDNPHKLQKISQAQSDMPTEQYINNNQSYQTFIDSNGSYGNVIMAQLLVAAPDMQITEFNGSMVPPLAVEPSVQITPSIQSTELKDMVASSAIASREAYAELMDNHGYMVQKPAISPTESMTNFNYMAPRFVAAPIEQMIDFNDMIQLSEIANFNTMRLPSPYAPMIEYNGIMSIRNNHSTEQGFQQNLSDATTSGRDHVDQFEMAYGERDSHRSNETTLLSASN
uniref:Protein CUP-SHAPED COTYLEDON 1-like n=1 Tax=Elaeis guineensis var. tenera TaxID=51953 RepID=A0A6I9QI54_ELAGV|nr:protein CUP-SHAPED COTYLEDON 1-like [Elaeis guineensis]